MSQPLPTPSKPLVFAVLMVISAVVAILPARWTATFDAILQPLAWILSPVSTETRSARASVDEWGEPPPTRAEVAELRERAARLDLQLSQQQIAISELEQMLAEVSGLRDQLLDLESKIIVAPVVGGDASPARETLEIARGARDGILVGDWVAAGAPPQVRGPAITGRDPLLQQWLVGRISQVNPYTSTVQLTTDPHFGPELVWASKPVSEGVWQVADRECALIGLGNRQMRIDRAAEDYSAENWNVVLAPLAHPRPLALVVGRIVGSETLDTGLHYDLAVEPWADARRLAYVYVVSISR